MKAYEECLGATSLKMAYSKSSDERRQELLEIRKQLTK